MQINIYCLCSLFVVSFPLPAQWPSTASGRRQLFGGSLSLLSSSYLHLLSHNIDYNTFIVLSFHRIISVVSFGLNYDRNMDLWMFICQVEFIVVENVGSSLSVFWTKCWYFVETFKKRSIFSQFVCILDTEIVEFITQIIISRNSERNINLWNGFFPVYIGHQLV